MSDLRQALRNQLRSQRKALAKDAQQLAATTVLKQLIKFSPLQNAQHVACYASHQGELPTQPLIKFLWQQGKTVYLPVLPEDQPEQMFFTPFEANTKLESNRYAIAEPANTLRVNAQALDFIFLPLVAFDDAGHRLGMGKGYYDRALEFMKQATTNAQNPFLCGLAYTFQEVEALHAQHWDVPMHAVITDTQIHRW